MTRKRFSPFFTTITVENSRRSVKDGNFNYPKLKEKYNFEELEIKNNEIRFNGGYRILFCNMAQNDIKIGSAVREDDEHINTIIELLDDLGLFSDCEGCFVSEVDLISMLKFGNKEDALEYFTLSNNNELINELIDTDFSVEFKKDNKILKIESGYTDSKAFSTIALKSPKKFGNQIELSRILLDTNEYLIEQKTEFIKNRLKTNINI